MATFKRIYICFFESERPACWRGRVLWEVLLWYGCKRTKFLWRLVQYSIASSVVLSFRARGYGQDSHWRRKILIEDEWKKRTDNTFCCALKVNKSSWKLKGMWHLEVLFSLSLFLLTWYSFIPMSKFCLLNSAYFSSYNRYKEQFAQADLGVWSTVEF